MKNLRILPLLFPLLLLFSCGEYHDFDSLQVFRNEYQGNVSVSENGRVLNGVFDGDNYSGTYSFVWKSSSRIADVKINSSSGSSGSADILIKDAEGADIFLLNGGGSGTEVSGVTEKGKKGKWLITLRFDYYTGDGSFEISPI